eukprot:544574_1
MKYGIFMIIVTTIFSNNASNIENKCDQTFSDLITANNNGEYELSVCYYFDSTFNISRNSGINMYHDRNIVVLNNGYTAIIESSDYDYSSNTSVIWVTIYNSDGNLIVNHQNIIQFDSFSRTTTTIIIPSNTYDDEFIILWSSTNYTNGFREIKHATFNSNNIDQTDILTDGQSFTPKLSVTIRFDKPVYTEISNNNVILMFQTSSETIAVQVFDINFNLLSPHSYPITHSTYYVDNLESLSIACINTDDYIDICMAVWYKTADRYTRLCGGEPRYNMIKIIYDPVMNIVNISDVIDDSVHILNELQDDCLIFDTYVYTLPNNTFFVWWYGWRDPGYVSSTYVAMYNIDNKIILNQTLVDNVEWDSFQVTNNGIIVGTYTTFKSPLYSYGNVWNNNWQPMFSQDINGSIILNVWDAFKYVYDNNSYHYYDELSVSG